MEASVKEYEDQSPARYAWQRLPDGRRIQFFVNVETNLIVVDVIDADERGGVEVYRANV